MFEVTWHLLDRQTVASLRLGLADKRLYAIFVSYWHYFLFSFIIRCISECTILREGVLVYLKARGLTDLECLHRS